MLKRLLAILGLLLCAAWLAFAAGGGEVYVVNTLSRSISVIDTQTDTVTATIPLMAQGYRIAFSPRGDKAYVTAAPGVMIVQMNRKEDYLAAQPHLVIVDTAKRKVEDYIPLSISAMASVHVHPNGRTVFIVTAAETGKRNEERGRVIFLDVPNRHIIREVPVGLNPLDSVMTPDGSKLFVANYFSRDVSVVNLNEGRLQDNIPLGSSPVRAVAMRPDGKKVYVVQERSGAGTAQDARLYDNARRLQNRVLAKGEPPPSDGNLLWEIDTTTHEVTKFAFDGLSPVYALTVSPDGKRLYAYGRSTALAQNLVPSQLVMRQGGMGGGLGGAGGEAGKAAPTAPAAPGAAKAKSGAPGPAGPPAQSAERSRRDAKEPTVLAQQQAMPVQQQAAPAPETTALLLIDLNTKQVIRRLSDLPLSAMTFSPDGKKLYLVGTPGEAAAEARANRLAYGYQQMDKQTSILALPKTEAPRQAQQAPPAEGNELVEALRSLPKTVTVLDAQTGKVLKTLTVGSLPQGAAARDKVTR